MEIQLPLSPPPIKHSVFDNYVPIITTDRHTDVYLTDQIEAPSEYNELCRLLQQAYRGDTITLHINNGGGFVDSGFMIIDAINSTKAVVTAKLTGTVASISTIIALSCHKIIVTDHTGWLTHNYSGGAHGKGGEIKAQVEFTTKQLNSSFRSIHKGFFTDEEMDLVIEDKDMWLAKDEVLARWNARKNNDLATLEEIAAARKASK